MKLAIDSVFIYNTRTIYTCYLASGVRRNQTGARWSFLGHTRGYMHAHTFGFFRNFVVFVVLDVPASVLPRILPQQSSTSFDLPEVFFSTFGLASNPDRIARLSLFRPMLADRPAEVTMYQEESTSPVHWSNADFCCVVSSVNTVNSIKHTHTFTPLLPPNTLIPRRPDPTQT